jgi:serine phosphatase RsbU (regulator of sigma subunit)/pSer/pThr/pTyr-binding forkhead associated (FHA) protein
MRWDLEVGTHTVGRAPSCAIVLPDPSVSRLHAEIRVSGDGIEVADAGSRNGTFVNGARITQPVAIRQGDRVRLGSVDASVSGVDLPPPQEPAMHTIFSAAPALRTSARMTWDAMTAESEQTAAAERLLFRALTEAGQMLVRPRPLDEVFDSVLDLVTRTITARRVLLLLKEHPDKDPVVRAARPAGLGAHERIMLSSTIVEGVLTGRESLLVTDALEDPRFRAQESIVLSNVRSAMVAPLFDNENVLGLIYADTDDPLVRYDSDQLRAFTMLANLIAVKITNTRLLQDQRVKERMEQEMATAAMIQRNLLPAELPETPGYEVFARQDSCLEVAGDLYDASRFADGSLCVVVGDVSGKGMGAALLMSHTMSALRLLYEDSVPPALLVERVHKQVLRWSDARSYLTLFLGRLDPASGRLDYVNAGHNPPLLFAADGTVSQLDPTGMPVGLMAGATFETATVTIPPGGLLAIFSDGIPEAHTDEEEFGDERLCEELRARRHLPLAEVTEGVLDEVRRFLGDSPPTDDITLFLLRRRA